MTDPSVGPAVAFVVLAMIGLSAGIYQGKFCAGMDAWIVTALGLTASTSSAVVFAVSSPVVVTDLPMAMILLVVIVVFTSVGAKTLYSACIKAAGARAASILFAVIPAAAAVMAWVALDESLSILAIGGLVLGAAAWILQARPTSDISSS